MNNPDFRLIDAESLSAARAKRDFVLPKSRQAQHLAGLRYERRVKRQLTQFVTSGKFYRLEHNPWFTFSDSFGASVCCPDFLLWPNPDQVLIVEVKLTWLFSAMRKVVELYMPVVEAALHVSASPLIIIRNSTPEAPSAAHTLRSALSSDARLLQYFDNGGMIW